MLAKGDAVESFWGPFEHPRPGEHSENPGPERAQNSWLTTSLFLPPAAARPQEEEELLNALRPCVTSFVCPGSPVSTLCLNYLSFL